MRRLLLLDLDETLYPERRFMLSGYTAVARWIESRTRTPAREAFMHLLRAARTGQRGVAFQSACERFALPPALVPELRDVYRAHQPRLRLPRASAQMLRAMRPAWTIAVVTNGVPRVQRQKVDALRLSPLVDLVVCASEWGSGAGKPEPHAFQHALARFHVEPEQAVMVGDDPICDIAGARGLGIATIRLRRGLHRHAVVPPADDADIVVDSIADVPEAAGRLVQERLANAG